MIVLYQNPQHFQIVNASSISTQLECTNQNKTIISITFESNAILNSTTKPYCEQGKPSLYWCSLLILVCQPINGRMICHLDFQAPISVYDIPFPL